MKNLFLLALICLITCFKTSAQDDIVITGKKWSSDVPLPDEITKAIIDKFPNAQSLRSYKVPASGIKNGWVISEEYNLTSDDDIEYYTVSFYQNKSKYYGLFDQKGNLEMYKYKRSEATLPDAVKLALKNLAKRDYKTWKIDASTYYKTKNGNGNGKEYYEVTAQKSSTKKKIYVAPDGKIIKIK